MTTTLDVVVLGGGPAGLAAAIALARLGRTVAVLERTRYDRPRAGETFGGGFAPLLQAIGAWEAFQALEPVPFRGVQSAWGGPEVAERESIFNPFGEGWHVDRARFDACLARCAEGAGVQVQQGAGACALARVDGEWTVRPAAGAPIRARYLIDASGRGAPASAAHLDHRRWLRADRLVALVGLLHAPARALEPLLLLEPVQEGWWYSVPQPGGALLATLMTDADLLPARGRAALAQHFTEALGRTAHTATRAEAAALKAEPWIARADSGVLLPARGPGWRALGDAAMACDPLSGDGVSRALRSGLEAAPEIDSWLSGHTQLDSSGPLPERFREYLEMRGRYYAREPRWPAATFWARRRLIDWKTAPVFLDPRRTLVWDGTAPAREVAAPIEAILPPQALRGLLERLRTPLPAHEALAFLRAAAPLEDRRLLVGLQYLVHCGSVR